MKKILRSVSFILVLSLIFTAFAGCGIFDGKSKDFVGKYNKALENRKEYKQTQLQQILTINNIVKNVTVKTEITNDSVFIREGDNITEFSTLQTTDLGREDAKSNLYFTNGKIYFDTDDFKYVSALDATGFTDFYYDHMLSGNKDFKFDLSRFTEITGTTDENKDLTISYCKPDDGYFSELYSQYKDLIEGQMTSECRITEFGGEILINKDGELISTKESFTAVKNDDESLKCELVVKMLAHGQDVKALQPEKAEDYKEIKSVPAFYVAKTAALNSFENGTIKLQEELVTKGTENVTYSTDANIEYITDLDGVLQYKYEYLLTEKSEYRKDSIKNTLRYNGETATINLNGKIYNEKQSQVAAKGFLYNCAILVHTENEDLENITMTESDGKTVLTVPLTEDKVRFAIDGIFETVGSISPSNMKISDIKYTITVQNKRPVEQTLSFSAEYKTYGRSYNAEYNSSLNLTFGDSTVSFGEKI